MTHRHYTASWPRCRDCGAIADDFSEYCDDCRDERDQIEADAEGVTIDVEADCVPAASACTCRMPYVSSAALEPPEPILDRYCPVHGDGGPDPDHALEARRDQIREDDVRRK